MAWTRRGRRGDGRGRNHDEETDRTPTSLDALADGPTDAEPPVGLDDMATGPTPDGDAPTGTLHVPLDKLDSPNFDKTRNTGRTKRRWSRRLAGVARQSHTTTRDVPTLPAGGDPSTYDDETILALAGMYDEEYLPQYAPYHEEARRRGLLH